MFRSVSISCPTTSITMIVQIVLTIELWRCTLTEAASNRHNLKAFSSSSSVSSPPSPSSSSHSATSGVSGFKLDLDELQKRGLSPDDVLRHIRLLAEGRIAVDGTCLDGTPSSSITGPAGNPPRQRHHHHQPTTTIRVNQSTIAGQESAELERKFFRNRTVTCNDGSKAGYYIRKSPTGSKRWLVFLEGGWLCFDRKSCEGRWINTPHLMSSDTWALSRRGSGILSIDPTENPFIHDGNIVLVPYCSSDSWSGTFRTTKKGDFSFMGSLIIDEVFKELTQWHGLSSASTIFLAGSSAGGTGVLVNLDRVAGHLSRLAPGAAVRGIVDSGWFIDNKPLHPVECTDAHQCSPSEGVRRGIQLWHGIVPDACRNIYSKSEQWKCYFGYRLYGTLQTVVFVVQYLFDEAQITADNVGPPVHRLQWRYIHDLGVDIKNTLTNVSAVFAPACLSHMLITKSEWRRVMIDGCSLPEALQCWESGGTNEKNHYYEQNRASSNQHYQPNRAGRSGHQYVDPSIRLLTGYSNRRHSDPLQADQPNGGTRRRKSRVGNSRNTKNRNEQNINQKHNRHHQLPMTNTSTISPEDITNDDPITPYTAVTIGKSSVPRRHRAVPAGTSADRPRGQSRNGGRNRDHDQRHRHRRMSTSGTSVDVHEIHQAQQHSTPGRGRCCGHRRIDSCSWPQCNGSCPRVRNPFTGEEIDLVELLTVQFGVDVTALARTVGVDRTALLNMDHSELIRLLVRSPV